MSVRKPFMMGLSVLGVVALTLASCSSETPAGDGGANSSEQCSTCTPPDSVDLMAPSVSFTNDVYPIMRQSCAELVCHGVSPANATAVYPGAGLYLGPPPADTTTTVDAALFTSIIGGMKRASKTAGTLQIVAPGDAANSFMTHKLYGCQDEQSLSCTVQSAQLVVCKSAACGDSMPPANQPQLTNDQKNTIRRWIAQGAQDN